MRKRPTALVIFVCSLASTAAAESGVQVTLPVNGMQSATFPFANNCSKAQLFEVSANPPAPWLQFEPAKVNVDAGTSFYVEITANSNNRTPGVYHTSLEVICVSCAAATPPCFQPAHDFPVEMTVAHVRGAGEFVAIPSPTPTPRPTAPQVARAAIPQPYIPPDPPRQTWSHYIPIAGGALLIAAAVGLIVAWRGLTSAGKEPSAGGVMSAESARHQVRR